LRATRAFFFTCDLRRFIFIELRRSKFPMTLQRTRPYSRSRRGGRLRCPGASRQSLTTSATKQERHRAS
jgi:hypothetical protein